MQSVELFVQLFRNRKANKVKYTEESPFPVRGNGFSTQFQTIFFKNFKSLGDYPYALRNICINFHANRT